MGVVALLLSTPNIDVNQKDDEGKSALHWAYDMISYEWDNKEALKMLLDVPNIDVNIVKEVARTAQRQGEKGKKFNQILYDARLRRLIREQKRQVSKVLLDGLYDPDSPISKLLGVRTEVMGEIIWQKLVENWQIFPEHLRPPVHMPVGLAIDL